MRACSLPPATIISRRKFGIIYLILSAGSICAGLPVVVQSDNLTFRADSEPITPIPQPPKLDPRRQALGDQLFHDPRLSHDNTRSCGSCHDTQTNGATANARDIGVNGQPLGLNTPTVFNAALSFRLNWEGNFRSIERHIESILRNPNIMASGVEEILNKLRADRKIVLQFHDAYGGDPDRQSLLDALAVYERSLLTPASRFDRWLEGDATALTQEELGGYQLFKSLGCISCHQGVNVGGNLFQRHGIFRPLGSAQPELLRVPSLRNVATTPPYFHDGSAPALPDAIKSMGIAQLNRTLDDEQVAAIGAFLNTLTGTYQGRAIVAANATQQAAPP